MIIITTTTTTTTRKLISLYFAFQQKIKYMKEKKLAASASVVWGPKEGILYLRPLKKTSKDPHPDIASEANGILMLDSMKCIDGLVFNSSEGSVVGISCQDPTIVGDLFDNTPRQVSNTQYILQFLWRDEASKFDVLGPWFTHNRDFNSPQLDAIFWKVIQHYSAVRMHVNLVVCDAASFNISFITNLCCGDEGQTNSNPKSATFEPKCTNPFTERDIWFIVDPSHMLKNVRNQCFGSKRNGKKIFRATLSKEYAEALRKKLFPPKPDTRAQPSQADLQQYDDERDQAFREFMESFEQLT